MYGDCLRACRSIPAWAGQPNWRIGWSPSSKVYPRVGGATAQKIGEQDYNQGLSPRGRGNPYDADAELDQERSIPAWAGQPTPWKPNGGTRPWVYPRVGGATDFVRQPDALGNGLSPRGRGNPSPARSALSASGSIPAWAGQPDALGRPSRYGGLGSIPAWAGQPTKDVCRRPGRPGSIPAWAGQPCRLPAPPPRSKVYPRVGGATLTRNI